MFKIEENIALKSRKSDYAKCIDATVVQLKINQSFLVDLALIPESTLRQIIYMASKTHQIRLRVEKVDATNCRVFRLESKSKILKRKIKRSSFLWIKNHPGTTPRVLANQLAQEGDPLTVDQVKHIMENLDVYDIPEPRVPLTKQAIEAIQFKTGNGMRDIDIITTTNKTLKTNITQEDIDQHRVDRGALW